DRNRLGICRLRCADLWLQHGIRRTRRDSRGSLYSRALSRSGLGKGALAEMRAFCIEHGIRAVSVEVGRENDAAQEVYRTAGFSATDRQLLTLELAKPVHVA
ncbi:MAG: GNAT family N-acetyltransferase, partial [Verrucomicrobiota bacterium]|nr:GNAT family N-acetyltransferase [Verrucomicrobiota bacterium]